MNLFVTNETEGMPDEDYMNHTAWYTSSGHNEKHRLNAVFHQMKQKCGWNKSVAPDDCGQWNYILRCLYDERTKAQQMSVGGRGARRVRDRMMKAASQLISRCTSVMQSNGCPIFGSPLPITPTSTTSTTNRVFDFIEQSDCKVLNLVNRKLQSERKKKGCKSGGGFIGGMFPRPPRPPKPPRPGGFISGGWIKP